MLFSFLGKRVLGVMNKPVVHKTEAIKQDLSITSTKKRNLQSSENSRKIEINA